MKHAQYIGKYKGKRYYRVPCKVVAADTQRLTHATIECEVIAPSARDAANYLAQGEYSLMPNSNIYAYGPRGGRTFRFVGYETAIYNAMRTPTMPVQLPLPI